MTRRRHSSCPRHPSTNPTTGICPSCLHDRLSFLDSSLSPDLLRSKSQKHHSSLPTQPHPRRKSCDVMPRHSLSHLLDIDIPNLQSNQSEVLEASRELGISDGKSCTYTNKTTQKGEKEDGYDGNKTMKEHIELEFKQPLKRSSVFAQKLQIWRLKQLNKKKKEEPMQPNGPHERRRRSCDTDPRFSTDVDDPRFDPPRASWDGYMIARTIPRLAPMLPVIENAMMNEQAIMEDDTNSVSESSSSYRRNSFDCSSSGKSSSNKLRAPVEIDYVKSVLPIAKIVVNGSDTGDFGFDLYKDCSKNNESVSRNADSIKRKMLRILGFRTKSTEASNG